MYDTIHLYRWRTVGGRWPNFGSSAFMLPHCLLNLHVRNTQQNGMQMANNSEIRQFPFVSHSRYSTNMNNLKRGAKVYNTKFFSLCSWCEKCKSNTKMSRHTHLSCDSIKEKNERKIAASERNLFCCSTAHRLSNGSCFVSSKHTKTLFNDGDNESKKLFVVHIAQCDFLRTTANFHSNKQKFCREWKIYIVQVFALCALCHASHICMQ